MCGIQWNLLNIGVRPPGDSVSGEGSIVVG